MSTPETRATSVVILLDRSQSMSVIRQATVDGLNKYIKEVQEQPGEGFWTLVQFDDPDTARGAGEEFPLVSFALKPDKEVPTITMEDFKPRGNTALIEAACLTLARLKTEWLAMPEAERPRVLILIVTDGQNNIIREFRHSHLRELTGELQTKHGWIFSYLGANQDAFAESDQLGITTGTYGVGASGSQHVNKTNYEHTSHGILRAMSTASSGTRAWKADNNPTAEQLLSSAEPEPVADVAVPQSPVSHP